MICSTRSYEKCLKEGLRPMTAKYKATYLYVYLADEIKKVQARLRRDPANELTQEHLKLLQRNKKVLSDEKDDTKVCKLLDCLYEDLYYGLWNWQGELKC
jgi:transcriptional/translational regulatory protein YebC/TACO1